MLHQVSRGPLVSELDWKAPRRSANEGAPWDLRRFDRAFSGFPLCNFPASSGGNLMALISNGLNPEPFWYKSGVIYEVHVRAFSDSDDNGIGDFRGLTSKLDYLKDLGITALWLLPFYPSPLKDDGYDTADYFDVHPMYGTLADFKVFLQEAHRRGPARHHRAGAQPHLRPASVVPTRPPRQTRQPLARILRLERHPGEIQGHAHHLQGHRGLQLDLGRRGRAPITGTASSRTSRTSTGTTRRCMTKWSR